MASHTVPARYRDPYFHMEAVKLTPGQYYATNRDLMLVTVLGSCVAACIRDPVAGCGGMNHFMLPGDAARSEQFTSAAGRYGVNAMELLINALLKHGAKRERLEAKVFGGGAIVDGISSMNVGRDNAEFVLEFLRREGITVAAADLEGALPRKVYYTHKDGSARVRYLRTLTTDAVVKRENAYLSNLRSVPQGEIALFGDAALFSDERTA